ncbi:hypothetical protein [Undibacterium sp.]|uniref:hypothetical protein n=1 Tax=Undibacterium sp. TaxID=1914977 RepID=UPI00374D1CB6
MFSTRSLVRFFYVDSFVTKLFSHHRQSQMLVHAALKRPHRGALRKESTQILSRNNRWRTDVDEAGRLITTGGWVTTTKNNKGQRRATKDN